MRGSSQSRKASPSRLKARTAVITAAAGKITRCGASKRWPLASFSMAPQLGIGARTPRPRKLSVDSFGNLLTNLTPDEIPALITNEAKVKIKIGNKEINHLSQTFADGAGAEPIALIGSNGALEISVNKGHAAKALGVNRGSEVTVEVG